MAKGSRVDMKRDKVIGWNCYEEIVVVNRYGREDHRESFKRMVTEQIRKAEDNPQVIQDMFIRIATKLNCMLPYVQQVVEKEFPQYLTMLKKVMVVI